MAAPVCCDTSFLFSLYGRDGNTTRATAAAKRADQPVTLTAFNEFELLNAIHLAVFRQVLPPSEGTTIIAAFESDLANGNLVMANCNLSQVLTEAKRLSVINTPTGGYRSFDILHVAAAVQLSAKTFFSFDDNQRTLAQTVGLKVQP
jgi:predicted nucleic acid-binding protein